MRKVVTRLPHYICTLFPPTYWLTGSKKLQGTIAVAGVHTNQYPGHLDVKIFHTWYKTWQGWLVVVNPSSCDYIQLVITTKPSTQ